MNHDARLRSDHLHLSDLTSRSHEDTKFTTDRRFFVSSCPSWFRDERAPLPRGSSVGMDGSVTLDEAGAATGPAAHRDVLGDREAGHETELLVDHGDAT